MVWNAQTDGLAARVLQAARDFTGGPQHEREAAGCRRLEQAIRAVIHPGIARNLGQVAAHERKWVCAIHLSNGAHALDGRLIAHAAPEGIAGVRRVHDESALPRDLRRMLDQSLLRMCRMDDEMLC